MKNYEFFVPRELELEIPNQKEELKLNLTVSEQQRSAI